MVVGNVDSGFGVAKWSDGTMYIGEFSGGKMQGNGKFCNPDGSVYVGEFKNNSAWGYGLFSSKSGATFEGMFANSKPEGICVEKQIGIVHEGEYRNGRKNGIIKTNWTEGRLFFGQYVNNVISGIV